MNLKQIMMPTYLLDTNHMTILERESSEARILKLKLARLAPQTFGTTIISYEEQSRGWLAVSAKARTLHAQVEAYKRLNSHLFIYSRISVLQFDERAASIYQGLRDERIRIGTMDLKIAAIALANEATLLTRNLSDFQKVPNLRAEDWSI